MKVIKSIESGWILWKGTTLKFTTQEGGFLDLWFTINEKCNQSIS